MAQVSDFILDNQGFSSFRTELNNILAAQNSNNSGSSRPSSATTGTIWLDTTNAGSNSLTLKFFDGSDDISLATIDTSANTVNWLDSTVSFDIVNDTTPQLGGNLDTNSHNIIIDDAHAILDENNNEQIIFQTTASAVNQIDVTNSATGNAPEISATGGDTNIDLKLTPKGSGKLNLDGIKFPNADGSADQVLATDGSGNLSFVSSAGGGAITWQSSIKTANFTAVNGEGYFVNTTSGEVTVTLPSSPSSGNTVAIKDYAKTFDSNKVTVNRNGSPVEGETSNPVLTTEGIAVTIVYADSTKGWVVTQSGLASELPASYNVDMLVVAGGGGGGAIGNGGGNHAYGGGGGGAGGFRTQTAALNVGTSYTVTVGDGGTGGVDGSGSPAGEGSNGSNSSVSGSGFTTFESAGGGRGGTESRVGQDGGSGGGGGGQNDSSGINYAGGDGNTPSTSPSQGNDGGNGSADNTSPGGGGGGAGQAGQNFQSSTAGGNGGNGSANSITGSSVTRAGGGGGGGQSSQGSGGSGGGGNAGNGGSGQSGTANTGGGGGAGGGGSPNHNGGAGGKGVVILSIPTANYSSTVTGSPTVTTSGSNTIVTFNSTGSYTA